MSVVGVSVWSDRDFGPHHLKIDFDIFTEAILEPALESLRRTKEEYFKDLRRAYIIPNDSNGNFKVITKWKRPEEYEITLDSKTRNIAVLETLFPTFKIADFEETDKPTCRFPEEGSLEPQEKLALMKMVMTDLWEQALKYEAGRKNHS